MKALQITGIFIGSLVITILTVYLPVNGIKIPEAIYCGPPAGLPFAFTIAKWKLPPDVSTCMAVLPPRAVLSALMLNLIIYIISVITILKVLKVFKR